MYEKFKRWLKRFLKYTSYSEILELEEQYKNLINKIFYARTLSEFMVAHYDLKDFKKAVEDIGSPPWAKSKLQTATHYWNKRYKMWKARG